MFTILKKFVNYSFSAHKLVYNYSMTTKYEEAVNYINSLQSNAAYIQNLDDAALKHTSHSTTLAVTQKYLLRSGITLEQLDNLPVIHVSGTKGKGSTCAFCESILRHHGYKTGLYTSPHLISLRERIKINGKLLSETEFADNVITIYKKLREQSENDSDMPLYFRFLTIVAFNIFIAQKVDIAVIEVGIGGEYDCTNILRKTKVCGITSLALEHTPMLGTTIEEIAWQKAGIMKPNAQVFTVKQKESAMTVLKNRATEKNCQLHIIPKFDDYDWGGQEVSFINTGDVQAENASMAIQLAHQWMSLQNKNMGDKLHIPASTRTGLEQCKWPGRFQILKWENKTIFLDGAHTTESMEKCAEWFKIKSKSSNKVLIFNMTGNRNAEGILEILSDINLNRIIFVPNVAFKNGIIKDHIDLKNNNSLQMERCEYHKNIWSQIQKSKINSEKTVSVFSNIEDAMDSLPKNLNLDILITGSLHLVGSSLSILDQKFETF